MKSEGKILAIDDNPVNISIFKELLDNDYDLEVAMTGKQGLEIASKFMPDVILLDIMMPGMDGYETCRLIRENPDLKYTKVIIVSAKTVISERLEGYNAGADDYVTKPFDVAELLAKIRVYLRLKTIEELDQMKSELTVAVTHELRTPLCIVKNIISNIIAEFSDNIELKLSKQLMTIDENIDRLAKLICNFFDASKIDAGKMELELSQFNTQDVVSKVIELFRPIAAAKGIELSENLPSEQIFITADHNKVIQILTNLIENAIKYSNENGHIEVRVKDFQKEISIEVQDDGPGIDPRNLHKIFNRFVQVKRKVGPGEQGTGLGLSIVKGLVELHSGQIMVESSPGKGANFCIVLPKEGPCCEKDMHHQAALSEAAISG